MIVLPATVFVWATTASFVLLLLALLFACVRLLRGPSLADRVVALDLVVVVLIAIAALLAVRFEESAFLDPAMALALIAFLATAAFARYAERRAPPDAAGSAEGERA